MASTARERANPVQRHAVDEATPRRPIAEAVARRDEARVPPVPNPGYMRGPRMAAQRQLADAMRGSPRLNAQRSQLERLVGGLAPGDPSTVQRRVTKMFRQLPRPVVGMPALVKEVRAWWQRYVAIEPAKYPDSALLLRRMRDEDIGAEAASAHYLTDHLDHPIGDVAEAIYARLRTELLHRQAVLDSQPVASGIKAAVLATSAETTGLRARTRLPSPDLDLHAPAITFRAVAGVLGDAQALNGWELGITQTVLKVNRHFTMRVKHAGQSYVQEQRTTLATPTNDRNSGATAPWYNEHKPVGGRGPVDVSLMDMPGESFNLDQGATVDSLQTEGADEFGTWLILWHAGTQSARFLGGWTWTVDYGDPAGARTSVSGFAPLDGRQPAEAVLLGARCRDVLVSTASPLRRAQGHDDAAFAATERREQAVLAFRGEATKLRDALKGADAGLTTLARDRLLQAWKALGAEAADAEKSDLLGLLDAFEMTVHQRRPSQDALKATYGIG